MEGTVGLKSTAYLSVVVTGYKEMKRPEQSAGHGDTGRRGTMRYVKKNEEELVIGKIEILK